MKAYRIFWKSYDVIDDFSGKLVRLEGWSHDNQCEDPEYCNAVGIFDSYVSAMADAMGLWEEYCEYHRTKKASA